MRHLKQESEPLDESALQDLLREVAAAEQKVSTPARVEQALMEAWDAHHRSITPPHRRSRVVMWGGAALAASLVAAVIIQQQPTPTVNRSVEVVDHQNAWADAADASHGFSSVAWLEPDPTTLQIVRLRVPSTAFAAQGYRLNDVDGDGTVEIDVLMGADGEARGIRVRPEWTGPR